MFSYKFEIDKDACFAYWAQSSLQWNWYFNQKEFDKWVGITGEFNSEEKGVLGVLKDLLQKKNSGYFWLWNRYEGNKIEEIDEQEKWLKIKSVLKNKFEIIWQSESPKLLIWLNILKKYDFEDLNSDFGQVDNFFGKTKSNKEIKVKLLFGFGQRAGGNTKKEFPNSLLLLLSGTDVSNLENVLKVLIHESIHLVEYSSKKDLLFRQAYKEIIVPLGVKQTNPSWRHLIVESIVGSFVGRGIGYLDKKIKEENLVKEFSLVDTNKDRNNFYNQKILLVSCKIAPLTEEYLKQGKEMDLDYVRQVLHELSDLVV